MAIELGEEYPHTTFEVYTTYLMAAARAEALADQHIPADDNEDYE